MLRIITILICWLLASLAVTSVYAQRTGDPVKDAEIADRMASRKGNVLKIAENAPDQYVVKRGDTLWDISSKYLTDPWRWPELWRGNKDQIKDPHWIYPGDVLVLDRTTGTLTRRGAGSVGDGTAVAVRPNEYKLSPATRAEANVRPIPVVPANVIEPYLSRPLVLDAVVVDGKIQEAEVLRGAPRIVGAPDDRYILSAGDTAYVQGLTSDTVEWNVFRPGEALVDPDNGEVLGLEAIFLGKARVIRRGEPATIQIRSVKQEISRGDRLLPGERDPILNYTLKRAEKDVKGRLMSVYGGVGSGGQFSIITVNRGSRDGLEPGTVLALFRSVPALVQAVEGKKEPVRIEVPDERYGLVTVFRTTERVAYAIVMEANRPLNVGDGLRNP
jgi:hypothetical protein